VPADPEISPITLHSRTQVFENTVFRVFADHVSGGGMDVPRYLTVAPKGSAGDLVTGIAVLPMIDGRHGLIRVYRHALGRWLWEVPRGFVDAGESAEQAAARELLEETGYQVAAGDLEDLGAMAPEPGVIAGRVRLFGAPVDSTAGRQAVQPEIGHGSLAFLAFDELAQSIARGEIEDGCTLAIVLRVLLLRQAHGTAP
jgi:ADP-ribose pyrophosphatase